MSIVINTSNSNDVLYAATSDVLETYCSGYNTNSITVSCGQTNTITKIEFLPDPYGSKFANSFAIQIVWSTGAKQEILFGCADPSVNGARWVTSNGVTLSQTQDETNTPTTITVSRVNTEGTKGSIVTRATINDYWVANYGLAPALLDPSQMDTTVGSYVNPAVWYWNRGNDGGKSIEEISRNLSWTKPSTGVPIYYIIVLWKGYALDDVRQNNNIGTIMAASGRSISLVDQSTWWSADTAVSGKKMKYTIHAIYNGGPNPSFSTAYNSVLTSSSTGLGGSAIEDWAMWWEWNTPPTRYNIKFYEQNKSTPLTDGYGTAYDYYAPRGANIAGPTDIKINGIDVSDNYILLGYYKKVGSGSWSSDAITTINNLGAVQDEDLSFAQKLGPNQFTIYWKNWDGSALNPSSTIVDYGVVPTFTGATPTRPNSGGYSYTFSGWSPTPVAATADATYTAQFSQTDIRYTVTYKANGSGQADVQVVWWEETYTIKAADTFTREDYVFGGWNTSSDATGDWYEPGSTYTGMRNLTLYAIWIPEWDYYVDIDILHYVKPSLKIAAKRHSLERADDVTLVVKPTLHPLYDTSNNDKNFVTDTSKINYREEDPEDPNVDYRGNTNNDWRNLQYINSVTDETREEYRDSDYDYPTYHTEGTLINSLYRTDLIVPEGVFDIDKEYHLEARLTDALASYGLKSPYTDLALSTGDVSGTKTMGNQSIGNSNRYNCQSDWSNVALLLKYITKLLVHNPFMDEVLKESRELTIVDDKPVWEKQLRTGSNPPETDFWQIREHTQGKANLLSEIDKLLKDRSNAMSVNGFTQAEIADLLIPTLKRALVKDENLVYDPSQIRPLLEILGRINPSHDKIKLENNEYAEYKGYEELTVGDLEIAQKLDTLISSARILEVDGERHQGDTNWIPSDRVNKTGSNNTIRDTDYKNVELKNFEQNQAEGSAQSTIDHIYDYDISQLDLKNSLSDLTYILSRMVHRQLGDEDPVFNESTMSRDQLMNYWDSTNNRFKDTAFRKWKPSTSEWLVPENDISEYTQYDLVSNYNTIAGSEALDPSNDYGANDFLNNGCNATCMGLCTSGCYGSCVGSCATACGDSCFFGCQNNCYTSCGGGCDSTCRETCSSSCGGNCSGTCVGNCSNTCTGSCTGTCGVGCSGACEAKCKRSCTSGCSNQCTGACQNHCTNSCSTSCGSNCSGSCKGSCKGNCSGGCNTSCGDSCNRGCSKGCGGGCSNSCATSCGSGCEKSCSNTCELICTHACEDDCEYSCSTSCIAVCASSCSTRCTGSCSTVCTNDCKESCIINCTGNCKKTCSTDCYRDCQIECTDECKTLCTDGCSTTCIGTCIKVCWQTCSVGCSNNCGKSCTVDCAANCATTCSAFCETECSNVCKANCSNNCGDKCKVNCTTVCLGSCQAGCGSNCGGLCGGGCNSYCQGQCATNCDTACGSGCATSCVAYCTESCKDSCASGCHTSCTGACISTCSGSCSGTCVGTCGASCRETCASCDTSCTATCMITCQTDCSANCGNNCSSGCKASCSGTCGKNCYTACQGGCEESCGKNCTGGCINSCSGTCGTSCSTSCGTSCNSDCQGTCKNQCSTECSSNCSAACSASCSGTCGESCTGSCLDSCDTDCTGKCVTTCSGGCQGGCGAGCSTGCESSCQGACFNSCSTTCHAGCVGTAKLAIA